MIRYIIYIILIVSNLYSQDCPPNDTIPIFPLTNQWNIPNQNNWNDLEVMTWNIKEFPISSNTTNNVIEVIADIMPDIIAFQEILDLSHYYQIEDQLEAYEFIHTNFSYGDLGIAVRKDCVQIESYSTLFLEYGYDFAWRYPFKVNVIWNCGNSAIPLQIINVHFKCCTDGFERRLAASQILSDYINIHDPNSNIIVLGDFNDDITDSDSQNSLLPLIDNNNSYFVTSSIASNSYYDSYPFNNGYSSFIDHILVSNNLLSDSQNDFVSTIRLDDFMGYYYYQNYISDHRPVFWSTTINLQEIPQGLVINEIMNNPNAVEDNYGEWFEIINSSNNIINLNGYEILDAGNDSHIIGNDLFIYPDDIMVFGINQNLNINGNIDIDYEYSNFYLSNNWDEIIIKHPYGIIIDQVEYNPIDFPNQIGKSMMLVDFNMDNNLYLNWIESENQMENGDYGTPNQLNDNCQVDYDLNNDSLVNIVDIIILANHILGQDQILNECIADFNEDGLINVLDIVYIVEYILADI